ncbi:MAG: hypothetical protein PHQ62_03935 [Clostridia bacterium]|nr:hypothetical protein [Clostridia bacterium]
MIRSLDETTVKNLSRKYNFLKSSLKNHPIKREAYFAVIKNSKIANFAVVCPSPEKFNKYEVLLRDVYNVGYENVGVVAINDELALSKFIKSYKKPVVVKEEYFEK